jgi:DNA-binding NarL/FixJ family response regulator
LIKSIIHHLPEVDVICLSHGANVEMVLAASQAGARGYLDREEVGIGLASAVRFIMWHRFVVTESVAEVLRKHEETLEFTYTPLPERRSYPRLTTRIEQALWLCVVEGLPAERAAEEMGVSTSTVRSYIKEGYRILEAEDETVYPAQISPAERAFLRYSALDIEDATLIDARGQPAA